MRRNWYCSIVAVALIALLAEASWAQPTPGYNTKIPESIMTPNDLKTRIGTFKYFDGIPTKETAEGTCRKRIQLAPDGSEEGLVLHLASL